MQKIVPSFVVRLIDQEFASLDQALFLGLTHCPTLAAVVALYDRIPDHHFSSLSADSYASLIAAAEALREHIATLRRPETREARMVGPIYDSPEGASRPSQSLRILRDGLSKCPDEAPSEHVPPYPFLGDLATVIQQDMTTAHSALGNGSSRPRRSWQDR